MHQLSLRARAGRYSFRKGEAPEPRASVSRSERRGTLRPMHALESSSPARMARKGRPSRLSSARPGDWTGRESPPPSEAPPLLLEPAAGLPQQDRHGAGGPVRHREVRSPVLVEVGGGDVVRGGVHGDRRAELLREACLGGGGYGSAQPAPRAAGFASQRQPSPNSGGNAIRRLWRACIPRAG